MLELLRLWGWTKCVLHYEVAMSLLGIEVECYNLNIKCPHRLMCLNTWSPVDGTIWEVIET
jgi:hypothetical protein